MMRAKFLRNALCLFVALIIGITVFPINASGGILHEEKKHQTVTSGVILEEITRMYESGWVDIYALRIDLTNPNVKLDVLKSAAEFGLRETVEQLAKSGGALAAANGDFFSGTAVSTSMGIVLREGNIDEARNYYNSGKQSYAGIYIDNQNKPYIDYLKISHLGFLTNGVSKIEIDAKNKVGAITKAVYIDRSAMTDTSKLDARFKDLYKIVVENGRIVDISAAGATKTVPENGFLIVMNAQTASEALKNFAVGDTATFSEYSQFIGNTALTPSNIRFGISGGSKIIENGVYKDDGLIIESGKRHPRTAVGINQQKTELIIAAIDGRNKYSLGATHFETYEIMKSLGCWDAFHLDGGGSTTVVAREEGQTDVTLKNMPSDGSQRKVANAIGVYSANAPGPVVGLYVTANGEKDSCVALATQTVSIAVTGYDANYNPVPITGSVLTQSGAGGVFSGNIFTPQVQGETVITAEHQGITASVTIKALSRPTGIRITPNYFAAAVEETVNLKAELINEEGYGVDITELSSVWSVIGGIGAFEGQGIFKASANGTGYVSVSYGGVSGTAAAAVGSHVKNLLDFETVTPVSYQTESSAAGSVAYSTAVKHDGNYSLNINYTFREKLATKQTAIVDFSGSTAVITEKPNAFAFRMTGDSANSTVNAVFTDGNGAEQVYGFSAKMDNGDWKYYYAKFSEEAALPLSLSRITITSAENLAAPVNGNVYLDTVHVAYDNKPDATLLKESLYSDHMRGQLLDSANVTEVAIFGPTAHISSEFEQNLFDRVIAKMQQNSRLAVFAGYTAQLPPMVTETLKWQDAYSIKDIQDVRIISLGTSKGGLRATDASQWVRLSNDLNNAPGKNVLLVLNRDVWAKSGGFSDFKERDLFHKTLKDFRDKTGANVLVVSGISSMSKAYLVDGIRYVTLNGLVSETRAPSDYNILRLWVSGDAMSYDIESVE